MKMNKSTKTKISQILALVMAALMVGSVIAGMLYYIIVH